MRSRWPWVLLLGSIGCAGATVGREQPDSGAPADSGPSGPSADADRPGILDAAPSPVDASGNTAPATFLVYAHTAAELYTVNPETLTVTLVGPFKLRDAVPVNGFPPPPLGITDIAVDHDGGIVGISGSEVLRIDARTAECTHLANSMGFHGYNGLSWVATTTGEILLATAGDGTVWRIDPTTGASTSVGTMGAGMGSSGDLVSVNRFGTLATIKRDGQVNDWLARVDPATGVATPIGDIGFTNVWGIGFWKDRVLGFCESGKFILIDPATGMGTLSQTLADKHWWGAGVTTSVYVIP